MSEDKEPSFEAVVRDLVEAIAKAIRDGDPIASAISPRLNQAMEDAYRRGQAEVVKQEPGRH